MGCQFYFAARPDVERQYLAFLGAGAGVNVDGDISYEKGSTPPRVTELTPGSNTNLATRLSNLGAWLQSRFQSTGDEHDLAEAISARERLVEFTPDGRLHGTFIVTLL
ncbi:hypothetical protein DFP72DRAFT_885496 [Ephemerocybe angulata]|uniref:Uncharacterized protein n=1 Tax=Ephemerocybe angulata TaxID=980116 RepID=A0A8H6I944_9AGAR|nr:hypothetical protein DFP72DRAFT_914642 [Tulosesus angulatus]KAF6759586.1 hypothetical protein DFP72DRAFT_885496 [Tulosesus angulatus]